MKPPERICNLCPNLTFSTLPEHADHMSLHNSTPAQWTEAYRIIQAGKEAAKKRDKADNDAR